MYAMFDKAEPSAKYVGFLEEILPGNRVWVCVWWWWCVCVCVCVCVFVCVCVCLCRGRLMLSS